MLAAFAETEGIPDTIKAGNVTKEPPPVTEFIAPASVPAKNISVMRAIGRSIIFLADLVKLRYFEVCFVKYRGNNRSGRLCAF